MKNKLKLGIINLIFSGVFIGLCFIFPEISIFFGFAGVCFSVGMFMLYQYFHWKSPSKQEEYKEKIENETIELHDERKEMIRGKAARLSLLANWCLMSAIVVIVSLLGQFEVFPYEYAKPVIFGITIYWIISAIIMQIIYKFLCNKY